MKSTPKAIVTGAAAMACLAIGGGAALFFLSCRSGEDILSGRRRMAGGGSPPTGIRIPGAGGGPLFRFGSPYLDGRSAWLAARFAGDREALRAAPAPAEPAIECVVHREAFTQGPWVAKLPAEEARQREEVESQAVESRVTFFVPRADPRAAIRYLVASDFLSRIRDEGKGDRQLFLPPLTPAPPGLRAAPSLAPNEFLTRDRWSRALAFPTDAFHLHSVFRDGDEAAHVLEVWENAGGDDTAPVRLKATQYAAAPRPDGTVVRITNYYSGQLIPPLLDGLVVASTRGFWAKVAEIVAREAPGWKPAPDDARWLDGTGL